jgi:uncharacterized protein YjcR
MTQKETSLLNFRIPNQLKHEFHALCTQNRTRMTSELVRMIKEYLRNETVDQEAYRTAQRKQAIRETRSGADTHGRYVKNPDTGIWSDSAY